MKKLILSLASLFVAGIANSQILQQENFETFTIGNVSADFSGATPGQMGWSTTGSANTDFQIINSGTDKDLQIIGAAGDGGAVARYMWKDGLDALWLARTPGNNVIQIEYDFFTGPPSTSKNTVGIELNNAAFSKYLGGFSMLADTKEIRGVYSPVTGPSAFVTLGATPVILPVNTWVRVGWAYNTTTGQVTFKGPGFNGSITGIVTNVFELDITMENSAAGNTSSFNGLFDNLMVRAVAAENLLGTSEVLAEANTISVFPNPAKDFVTVDSKVKILGSYIYDMSGIRMNAKIVDGKIDVKGLKTGVYILGLKTDSGLVTKKLIKE